MPDPRNNLIWNATCKVYPAIGDLQAIKDRYGNGISWPNINCAVSGSGSLPAATAGEIWVVTTITAVNDTSVCDISISPQIAGGWRTIKGFNRVGVGINVSWAGTIVLINPDYIRCYFNLGGGADTIAVYATGYKVAEY